MNAVFGCSAFSLDEQARADHYYLTPHDRCAYLATYLSVNRIISNLKCPPSVTRANLHRAHHKRRAIRTVAAMIRAVSCREWIESATWIPIPPSRAARDPDFDDRLTRILRGAFLGCDFDVRNILYQSASTPSDHAAGQRLRADVLHDCMRINWHALAARPMRERVILFDDVLTTGKHYKCCERRLREALPAVAVEGLFVARRALSARGRRLP